MLINLDDDIVLLGGEQPPSIVDGAFLGGDPDLGPIELINSDADSFLLGGDV